MLSVTDDNRHTLFRRIVDIVGMRCSSTHVVAYALASVFMGACVVIANGFLVAASRGEDGAYPYFAFEGLTGNSPLYGLLIAVLAYLFFCVVERFGSKRPRRVDMPTKSWIVLLLLAVALILAWMPVILAFFPGVLYHDTVFQLAQFFGPEPLDVYTGSADLSMPKISDHHPVVTTLVFGFFAWLGQLFGHAYMGLFAMILIQSAALALSLSGAMLYVRCRLQLGRATCAVLFLFCAFFPLFPLYAASLSKDVMFAPFFVAFTILCMEALLTKGDCFRQRSLIIALIASSLLVVSTKKVGVYIVFICMVIMLFRCRSGKTALLLNGSLSVAMVFIVLPFGLFPLIGAGPGSSKEMLAIPYEQTALYVKEHPEDVSETEREILDAELTCDTLGDRYRPDTADYVKNFAPNKSGILEYLGVYVRQGLRHPFTYLRAFLSLEAGFVGTEDKYLPLFETAEYDQLEKLDESLTLDVYSDMPAGHSDEALWYKNAVTEVATWPVVELLFTKALYVFIVPIASGVLILVTGRRRAAAWFLVPYFAFSVLLFVSPVSTGINAGRYVFPLLCSVPLVIGTVAYSLKPDCLAGCANRRDARSGAAITTGAI